MPGLTATRGERLTISLDDASRFVLWNISAAMARQTPGAKRTLARGGNPYGIDHVTVIALDSGTWIVSVALTFDRRRGSFLYFFRLTIP